MPSEDRWQGDPSEHAGGTSKHAMEREMASLSHEKAHANKELGRLQQTMAHSIANEHSVQRRVEKQQMRVDYHRSRADRMGKQIHKLNEDLRGEERSAWESHQAERASRLRSRGKALSAPATGRTDVGVGRARAGARVISFETAVEAPRARDQNASPSHRSDITDKSFRKERLTQAAPTALAARGGDREGLRRSSSSTIAPRGGGEKEGLRHSRSATIGPKGGERDGVRHSPSSALAPRGREKEGIQRSPSAAVGKLVLAPSHGHEAQVTAVDYYTDDESDSRASTTISHAEEDVSNNFIWDSNEIMIQRSSVQNLPRLSSMASFLQPSGKRPTSFIHHGGDMFSRGTCSVVPTHRGGAMPDRLAVPKLSPRSIDPGTDPYEAVNEPATLVEMLDQLDHAAPQEDVASDASDYLAELVNKGKDVFEEFHGETPEQTSKEAGLRQSKRNRDQWEGLEAQMDRLAETRRAAEERCVMLCFREEVSDALVEMAGSPQKAYKALDHNCSGRVSMNEFDGGMRGLGVNWQEITGFSTIRELFKLFDQDAKGYISFADLFPLDAKREEDPMRLSTPDFWNYYCRRNKNISPSNIRHAQWEAANPEDKLELIGKIRGYRETTEEKKKWMRGMIHRLKHRGKSDARCREIVAAHLPKGSGPRNLDEVHTFSQAEVHACKKAYADKVQESVRNIEKTVFAMHEQRRKLHHAKHQLYQTTEEPFVKAKALEESRVSLMQWGGGFGGFFKKDHHDEEEVQ